MIYKKVSIYTADNSEIWTLMTIAGEVDFLEIQIESIDDKKKINVTVSKEEMQEISKCVCDMLEQLNQRR